MIELRLTLLFLYILVLKSEFFFLVKKAFSLGSIPRYSIVYHNKPMVFNICTRAACRANLYTTSTVVLWYVVLFRHYHTVRPVGNRSFGLNLFATFT
jgi:hypothetical protein